MARRRHPKIIPLPPRFPQEVIVSIRVHLCFQEAKAKPRGNCKGIPKPSPCQEAILNLMKKNPRQALSINTVTKQTLMRRSSAWKAIHELVKKGLATIVSKEGKELRVLITEAGKLHKFPQKGQ